MRGIAFPTAAEGWFVADAGTIMHTVDGAATWQSQRSGTSAALNDVCFVGAATGWVVGASGVVRHTADGGSHWLRQLSGIRVDLNGVVFADARHGWAVGDRGVILRTVNGGKTWTKRQVGNHSDPLRAVACSGSKRAWAVGDSNLIVRTVDGGATWTAVRTRLYWENDLCEVTFVSATKGWVLANFGNADEPDGTLLRTTDGGRTWLSQSSGGLGSSVSEFQDVAFDASRRFGVATGTRLDIDTLKETPVIFRSRDGGDSWEEASTFSGAVPAALAVGPAGRVVIATKSGPLRCSDDQCSTWWQAGSGVGSGAELAAVDVVDGLHVWAVGDNGQIVATADGSTWHDQSSGTTHGLHDVAFPDARNGWAAGEDIVLRTRDGGASWSAVDVGTQATWECVVFADAQRGWLAGNSWSDGARRWAPAIVSTADGGASWTPAAVPASGGTVKALRFLDADRGWAVGEGLIWRTQDGGQTWTRLRWAGKSAPGLRDVVFLSPTAGFAVGDHCSIWKTLNGGASWKLVRAAQSASWDWLFDLNAVGFTSRRSGWAVGIGGVVLHSADGGATWVRQQSATDEELMGMDMLDDQHLWVVGGHASIITTSIAGGAARRR